MNYKEVLLFITKSLTITLEEKNKEEIKIVLNTANVDWESVVKISTSHYVLPAIYCNFRRADFLRYLPVDLVSYMEYIYNLNKERNTKILKQANDLNMLLLANNISPVFLKGTANLLEGLYDDIGERMVGDIDILLSKKNLNRVIEVLKCDGYNFSQNKSNHYVDHRHFPRLVKKENIAAVEIHKEVILEKYLSEFNSKKIIKDTQQVNGFSVLSFENQLSLSIISDQINDYGFDLKKISLRNAYDVLLLSKKVNTVKAISKFIKLNKQLNYFLANCNLIFGDLDSFKYDKTIEHDRYFRAFNKSIYSRESKIKINLKLIMIKLNRRFDIIYKSVFNVKRRKWLFNRIKNVFKF